MEPQINAIGVENRRFPFQFEKGDTTISLSTSKILPKPLVDAVKVNREVYLTQQQQ